MNERRKPHICTIDQLSKETGISAYTIRRWVKSGKVKHLRSGIKYLINYDTFVDFLESKEADFEEPTETAPGIRPVMSL